MMLRLLKGETKLWKAYWLFYCLPLWIFGGIFLTTSKNFYSEAPLIALIILLIYGFFEILSPYAAWKCAHNCNSKGWTSIARGVIVLMPILAASQLYSQHITNKILDFSSYTTIAIIAFYLIGKLSRSQKIINFNEKYVIPVLIIIGRCFLFIGLIFAGI
ncbi:MAG TPA: hypothetical protein VLI69_03115 [Gammaproteobacteria bacterium]|nr:hypothetical protein [Gammaproteobacteria bacterium]